MGAPVSFNARKINTINTDVNTLLARLTAARALYLNNLNNAQLLNIPNLSTLTGARIGYLDNINNAQLLNITATRLGWIPNQTKLGFLRRILRQTYTYTDSYGSNPTPDAPTLYTGSTGFPGGWAIKDQTDATIYTVTNADTQDVWVTQATYTTTLPFNFRDVFGGFGIHSNRDGKISIRFEVTDGTVTHYIPDATGFNDNGGGGTGSSTREESSGYMDYTPGATLTIKFQTKRTAVLGNPGDFGKTVIGFCNSLSDRTVTLTSEFKNPDGTYWGMAEISEMNAAGETNLTIDGRVVDFAPRTAANIESALNLITDSINLTAFGAATSWISIKQIK